MVWLVVAMHAHQSTTSTSSSPYCEMQFCTQSRIARMRCISIVYSCLGIVTGSCKYGHRVNSQPNDADTGERHTISTHHLITNNTAHQGKHLATYAAKDPIAPRSTTPEAANEHATFYSPPQQRDASDHPIPPHASRVPQSQFATSPTVDDRTCTHNTRSA